MSHRPKSHPSKRPFDERFAIVVVVLCVLVFGAQIVRAVVAGNYPPTERIVHPISQEHRP